MGGGLSILIKEKKHIIVFLNNKIERNETFITVFLGGGV